MRYIKKGAQLKQKAFQVECLSPENETGESNENSQVLLFKTDNLSVLFTGDMEQKGEDAVTEQLNERQEQIDILKVPHHGSKNSAKEAFLEACRCKDWNHFLWRRKLLWASSQRIVGTAEGKTDRVVCDHRKRSDYRYSGKNK